MARILLVEDNELNRDMLTRRLERIGYSVQIAVDGAQGLHLVGEAVPDMILLDMSLPKIDGWEVARQLKADKELRKIPIIALTAHAMLGDREQALAAGCDDYEVKPIDFPRLVGKVKSLLNHGVEKVAQ